MVKYKRLNLAEREEISRYLVLNYSYRQIALCLNRSPSTIIRETYRNFTGRLAYRAVLGEKRARCITKEIRRKRKLDVNEQLCHFVQVHLDLRWSPEQIAKRLKILYPNDMEMRVSHETIYAYLYIHPRGSLKRQMFRKLRHKHKNRRVKNKEHKRTHALQDFVSIEERPPEINSRKIAGHWEGDLIMGPLNQSAIGTLVERKTRLTLLVKLIKKDAVTVREAFSTKFNNLPKHLKRSLTYDQGQEMAEHKQFTEETNILVYFAHPHSPWERGTSENTNMLIRDFFPKGTDFSNISENKLQKVQNMLNDRPRKVLGWYTPNEIFTKSVALETRM